MCISIIQRYAVISLTSLLLFVPNLQAADKSEKQIQKVKTRVDRMLERYQSKEQKLKQKLEQRIEKTATKAGLSASDALALADVKHELAIDNLNDIAVPVDIGDKFLIRLGQTRHIANSKHAINFSAVLSDSRCPVDNGSSCVWEGNAELSFAVRESSGTGYSVIVNTNPEFPTSALIGNYRLHLLELRPSARLHHLSTSNASIRPYYMAVVVITDASVVEIATD